MPPVGLAPLGGMVLKGDDLPASPAWDSIPNRQAPFVSDEAKEPQAVPRSEG
jgi:hypothetical protein